MRMRTSTPARTRAVASTSPVAQLLEPVEARNVGHAADERADDEVGGHRDVGADEGASHAARELANRAMRLVTDADASMVRRRRCPGRPATQGWSMPLTEAFSGDLPAPVVPVRALVQQERARDRVRHLLGHHRTRCATG